MSVTQAGVAEFRWAVGVEEGEQLVGEVDPLLPLNQSLLHICRNYINPVLRVYFLGVVNHLFTVENFR